MIFLKNILNKAITKRLPAGTCEKVVKNPSVTGDLKLTVDALLGLFNFVKNYADITPDIHYPCHQTH